jgi:MFS family permease
MDLTPLRQSRDYRLLFFSGVITYLGSMITYVALPYQVATLTDSYLAVGLIGLVEIAPLIIFGLYGGALADKIDRRILVIATEVGALLLVAVLLVNALLPEPRLWVLYVIAVLLAANNGLQRPSLDAMTPRLVPHDQLAAAGALNTIKWNLGSIVGPAIGGLLLSAGGAASAYAFDVVSFAVSILLLWRLRSLKPLASTAQRPTLGHIMDGMRYAASRRDLLGTYAVDLIAMIFAFPYALFPFLAIELGAPWALGLLYAASAVGGLSVTFTSGWVPRINRHGRAVVFGALLWGAGMALVGLTSSLWWVLLFLALAGAGDMISGIFRGLIWNQTIPDEMRGRMAGIEMLSYSIGPQLGQVRSSAAASLTNLRMSFVTGGVMCIAGVAIAAFTMPSLWQYDVRKSIHSQRESRIRKVQDDPSST